MLRAARRTAVCSLIVLGAPACNGAARTEADAMPASTNAATLNTLTAREQREGWRLLFDGRTLSGWRGYRSQTMPPGWEAVDGALTRTAEAADIITTEQFRNFELQLEWKIAPGGNSGIFYRAVESDKDPIYYSAPEYQILDDQVHRDGQSDLTSAGANYALHPAPRGVVKPVGEWNTARIVVRGNHVEHWLNGKKIVDYELGSADWQQRVAKSKFNEWPAYGKAAQGYIGLQEHGSWVAFRNIKLRVLP